MGKGYRSERLGEEIRKIISDMLLRDLKDPRLSSGMVSLTGCSVTSDGSYATVYLSVLPYGETDRQMAEADILEGLEHSKGTIKKAIWKKVKLRHIPELIFKLDESMEYGRHMDELIAQVIEKDHEK